MTGLARSRFLLIFFLRTVKPSPGNFYPGHAALILIQFDVCILLTRMV